MADAPWPQETAEKKDVMSYVSAVLQYCPYPFPLQRPQKEEFSIVEDMLRCLLSKYSDLNLFSERHRKEVKEMVSILESVDGEPCFGYAECDETLRQMGKVVRDLAYSQRRLREYEKDSGNSWRTSICYPLDPRSIGEMPFLEPQQTALGELDLLLYSGKLSIDNSARVGPCHGVRCWDAMSLLSPTLVAWTEGGEQIEVEPDFRSKHVLVFCIHAPVLFRSQSFQSLLNLCDELRKKGDDVEIVMVARMNILFDTKEDFNHVFSGFPRPCYAVPYEDWERREHIWRLLDGEIHRFRCVIYNTSGLFLRSFLVDEFPCGAEAFPFDERSVRGVLDRREQLRGDRLENLLRPYNSYPPDDVVVYELNGSREKSISEVIKDKHAGLYLCCPGFELLPVLQKLSKEKKEEFEIVVLYLPYESSIDPQVFRAKIESYLQGQNVSGWWCLPFNNSVSSRFSALTWNYEVSESVGDKVDKLMIVGPTGHILDMYGGFVLGKYGIDAHPFTRAVIYQKRAKEVRGLDLESLLKGQIFFRGNDTSDNISGDRLLSSRKKIFVIYSAKPLQCRSYRVLESQYEALNYWKGGEFEAVFFGLAEIQGVTCDKSFRGMPWYIHWPRDASQEKRLAELFEELSVVGFGKDGHACSVKQPWILHGRDPSAFCPEDTLEWDSYCQLGFHGLGREI